jgi:hypothetical protein
MEEDDLSDPVFDDMDMTSSADRRRVLEVCRKTSRKKVSKRRFTPGPFNENPIVFDDWKVFVSLLVQMFSLDIYDSEVEEMINYNSSNWIHS